MVWGRLWSRSRYVSRNRGEFWDLYPLVFVDYIEHGALDTSGGPVAQHRPFTPRQRAT
jgi:hypothetical protein